MSRILPLAGVVVILSSCASHKPLWLPFQNDTQADAAFSVAGTQTVPDHWWVLLKDDLLNSHIETALANNFSLAAAWDRLQAARALARRDMAGLFPDLGLEAGARHTREEGDHADQFTFGPAASYELDLWGRLRSESRAAYLEADASQQAYKTAALTLSGEVALTWVRLVETYMQLDLLARQSETNEQALEVLRARFGIGQARSEDILRQQLVIEAIKEQKIELEADKQLLEHQLAVLRGEPPQRAFFVVEKNLPQLPPLPKTGLPSALVERRPDVQESYLRLAAADQSLAAAVRNQYPQITLSASYISEAASAGSLYTDWMATLAAALVAPLFDGGERQAEVARTEALRQEIMNLYGQTVLEAFQDVEDALIREQKQKERIENLESRQALAQDSFEQIKLGYFNGANEFISVLSAQDELQEIERDLLRARRDLIAFRIALYRALAGGFETPHEKLHTKN